MRSADESSGELDLQVMLVKQMQAPMVRLQDECRQRARNRQAQHLRGNDERDTDARSTSDAEVNVLEFIVCCDTNNLPMLDGERKSVTRSGACVYRNGLAACG